ncbi:MAG: hypothetical protein IPP17_30795 [Bacteroidetes bacterium]|nr:hypothetical protein [Bacteroidota bacterium]
MEVAACIKNGSGSLMRGKNDKVDASRIDDYATVAGPTPSFEHAQRGALLADLMASRTRLMAVIQ